MSIFRLKLISLIIMSIDHIGQFIPNSPIWFNWIGRMSAPIFTFCAIEAFIYTKNKFKYIKRLYIASVVMSMVQVILNIPNNYFRVILSTIIIIHIIDTYKTDYIRFIKMVLMYIIWQTFTITTTIFAFYTDFDENFVAYMIPGLLGSIFNLEGGLIFVILGVLLFLKRDSFKNMSIYYIIFCVVYLILSTTSIINILLSKLSILGFKGLSNVILYTLDTIVGLSPMELGGNMFAQNYQWMMVFSLPLIWTYNNERGYSAKYLFYIYYPFHIIFLFAIGKYM